MFTRPPLWWNQRILGDVPIQEKRPRNKSIIMFQSYKLDSWNLARKQALDRAIGLCCLLYSCLCKRTNNAFLKFYSVLKLFAFNSLCPFVQFFHKRWNTNNDVTIKNKNKKKNWNILYNAVVCNGTAVAFCQAQGRLACVLVHYVCIWW